MSSYSTSYNPDVLSTLANLSSDEVFTPPHIANQMLDLLPQELFSDKNTTFLDPATKSGVFLREITKRLLKGLENDIPDLQERIDHILHNQVFGIGTTELTSLISRRSLYYSKIPNSFYSVTKFNDRKGNIFFRKTDHHWQNGRCVYCNANIKNYDRGKEKNNHAYDFIHENLELEKNNMRFDVIIGNPPYQLSDNSGGSTDSANPIYHYFVLQALKLRPRYLSMIIPSKWMVGGRGLDKFRKFFSSNDSIEYLVDYENAKDVFPGVHLDGGACYFLVNNNYKGECNYEYHYENGTSVNLMRSLSNKDSKFLVRDPRVYVFLDKFGDYKSFSDIVSRTKPFGIRKYLFNNPSRIPEARLSQNEFKDSLIIHGVKGLKGGAKRVKGYIHKSAVKSSLSAVNKYKLFFTTSYSTNAIIPPEIILAGPGEVATETFLMVGPFDNLKQAEFCKFYMETLFFRTLLFFGKGTMQVNPEVFRFIPILDLNNEWTDELISIKYSLTETHINIMKSLQKGSKSK